ncbi:MAG TPA: glycoside hydrolase family 32 protein [Roseiflexaceae bacterium]|nr:glycoside hydrolase family 32 protein [Roseiflexaceae bacterium]
MRERFAGDPHRPAYHFLPPANWMNDPNGLIHWRGQYHLFYQYNPNGAFWGTMHWGHAVSPDMVRWRDLPIALAPGPEPYDAAGVYSGITVVHEGAPTIIYTATAGERYEPSVALAVGDEALVTWRKDPANPVLRPPTDPDIHDFRDHSAWREGEWWYQVIGAGIRGVGGAILLYRSRDLRAWEYLGPACVGTSEESGETWECPDLFELGGRHVLLVSPIPLGRAIYFTGAYADHRFTPELQSELDLGGSLYAPQTFRDAHGRRILFGWLREERPRTAQEAAGWSGVMSLPRVLTLLPDGSLGQAPAAEVETLRGRHTALAAMPLAPGLTALPADLPGDRLEVLAEIDVGSAAAAGLALRATPDSAERTLVYYDRPGARLVVDRTHASLDSETARDVRACPLALAPGEPLRLRVFVDRSAIEVFANGRACLASRVYPTRMDARGAQLFAEGAGARLLALDMWEMTAVWPA